MKFKTATWTLYWCLALTCLTHAESPATSPAIKMIPGTVPAKYHRSLAPSTDPTMADLLKRFNTPKKSFSYRMGLLGETDTCKIYRVLFLSRGDSKPARDGRNQNQPLVLKNTIIFPVCKSDSSIGNFCR
jgi:hypothetical protein